MKNMALIVNDFLPRTMHGHCPIDPLKEVCEKFFQIWSHKAANISNDLIEYTIRRMQSDRLRFLLQTRNEFTQREDISPVCQMSIHTEDDLRRIKEHIRRFCLTTRNLYRHLRSDSRLYPQMCIDLDQGIMIKICRFIFKTKVLLKILAKEQHLSEQQREQLKKYRIKEIEKKLDVNDPYRNLTKAFVVLQSNFEILYGDILDRDFFQNAKSAVQTLPIILDTSKTIRLIFCTLYKLTEPERQAEAEAIRQRRSAFCGDPNCTKNQENEKIKTMKEIFKTNQSQVTHTSATTPTKTPSSPLKTTSQQLETKTIESSKKLPSSKSKPRTRKTMKSKPNKNLLSPSAAKKTSDSSKKSSSKEQKKTKSPNSKHKNQKKSKNKNQNSIVLMNNNNTPEPSKNINSNHSQISSNEKFGWTTWLHNVTLNLAGILPSDQTNLNTNPKPLLTTWASLDRISKI